MEGWRMMRCTNQGEPVALGIHLEKRERERKSEHRERYFSPRVAVIIWPSCARVTSFLEARVTISCKLLNRPGFYLDLPSGREEGREGSRLFDLGREGIRKLSSTIENEG